MKFSSQDEFVIHVIQMHERQYRDWSGLARSIHGGNSLELTNWTAVVQASQRNQVTEYLHSEGKSKGRRFYRTRTVR